MPLIIESGIGTTNSNSYVSRADYIAHAALIGVTIVDDATADVQLVKAAQFIDAHDANLKGSSVTRAQSMSFPRSGVVIDSWYWASDEIPRNVLLAQYAFALDINAGLDLYNKGANPNRIAQKERVEGAVAVEYAITGGDNKSGYTSSGDSLLASLLNLSGLYSVELVRA